MVDQVLDIAPFTASLKEIGLEDIASLEQMVAAYPSCSSYRILLAKANANANLPLADHKLRLAGVYCSDNARLYQLFRKTEELSFAKARPETPSEELYDPTRDLIGLIPEDTAGDEDKLPTWDKPRYDPERELMKLIETPDHSSEEEANTDTDEEQDFFFWLNQTKDQDNKGEDSEVNQNILDSKTKEHEDSSVHQLNAKLDEFIQKRNSRPRPKREFYSAERKARESEIDDSELVTQTLAGVYEAQGLWLKAIDTYRKLSLQNPIKSAYFAARIRKAQDALDQNDN